MRGLLRWLVVAICFPYLIAVMACIYSDEVWDMVQERVGITTLLFFAVPIWSALVAAFWQEVKRVLE